MCIIMAFTSNIFNKFCLDFLKIMQFEKKEEVAIENSPFKVQ